MKSLNTEKAKQLEIDRGIIQEKQLNAFDLYEKGHITETQYNLRYSRLVKGYNELPSFEELIE